MISPVDDSPELQVDSERPPAQTPLPLQEAWPQGVGLDETQSRRRRIGALVRDVFEAVALALVIFFVLQIAIQNTVVEGTSMEPNFVDGERLLVNKLKYRYSEPQRGDVIVFHAPGFSEKDFIKRVVALPGDTISAEDGQVLIDGRPLEEPWLPLLGAGSFAPRSVPEGHYFVLGDNRPNSNDSRSWDEALPKGRIVGQVWLSVWPLDTLGLVSSDGPGPAAPQEPS